MVGRERKESDLRIRQDLIIPLPDATHFHGQASMKSTTWSRGGRQRAKMDKHEDIRSMWRRVERYDNTSKRLSKFADYQVIVRLLSSKQRKKKSDREIS